MKTEAQPRQSSTDLATSIDGLASLLWTAADIGRRRAGPRTRSQPARGAEPRVPPQALRSQPTADVRGSRDATTLELGTLIRGAAESWEGLERKVRKVLGPERSLPAALSALLELGGLHDALKGQDFRSLEMLASVTRQVSRALMATTVAPVLVQLRGRRHDRTIEVEEPYWPTMDTSVPPSWRLRAATSAVPDIWQRLDYAQASTLVAIRLTWYGHDRVSISHGGSEWRKVEDLREERTGELVGYVFESPAMSPLAGRVSLTMVTFVDRGSTSETSASYDIWVDIPSASVDAPDEPDPHDDGPVLVPTPIPDPVPSPGPNWIPTDLLATGIDRDALRTLATDLVTWTLDVLRDARRLSSDGGRAIHRDHTLLQGVIARLRGPLG
jgi:hypothetical protein